MTNSVRTNDYLIGPKLKIERAKQHLRELDSALAAYLDSNPYQLIDEVDGLTGENVFRVRIHSELSPELSIIIGDIAHNLRSALDQTVCALVRANRKQVSGSNAFPILGSKESFEKAISSKLKNVSSKAERFFSRLKPYKGGCDRLWLLAELSNADKHENIIPIAVGNIQVTTKLGIPSVLSGPDGGIYFGNGPPGSIPAGFDWGFGIPSGSPVIKELYDNVEVHRAKYAGFAYEININVEFRLRTARFPIDEPLIILMQDLVKVSDRIVIYVDKAFF